MRCRLVQHIHALLIGRVGVHELEILPDRSGEELRVLRDESDALAQPLEVDGGARHSVVKDLTLFWLIEADKELHQSRLSGARGSDECYRLAPGDGKRDVSE